LLCTPNLLLIAFCLFQASAKVYAHARKAMVHDLVTGWVEDLRVHISSFVRVHVSV
jgi:hypothetical protein